MAQDRIDAAIAEGADPVLIEAARQKMLKGEEKIAKGEHDKAINEFKRAWEHARDAA